MSDKTLRKRQRVWQESPSDETARNYIVEAARSDVLYAEGLRFLEGHWTLKPPTKPGLYFRATRNGKVRNPPIFVFVSELLKARVTKRGRTTTSTFAEAWNGYWWSEPSPKMPEPVPIQSSQSSNRKIRFDSDGKKIIGIKQQRSSVTKG